MDYTKIDIKLTSKYWIILKHSDKLEIVHFRDPKSMDSTIEYIVVSNGEENRQHNIIAYSMNYEELQQEIKEVA